jgi:hypothetical protein
MSRRLHGVITVGTSDCTFNISFDSLYKLMQCIENIAHQAINCVLLLQDFCGVH